MIFTMRNSVPETKTIRRWAVALLIPALLVGSVSCKKSGADAKPADVDYYTCTMHPSVKKQSPTDKCPICSMDLVPVMKKVSSGKSAGHAQTQEGQKGEMPNMPGMEGMKGMTTT